MVVSLEDALVEATLASSVAVLIVCLIRKPLRRSTGARSAYWAWLLVPASTLAVFMPASSIPMPFFADPLHGYIGKTLASVLAAGSQTAWQPDYTRIGIAIWLLGVLVTSVTWVARHHAFVRTLGNLEPGENDVFRSHFVSAPMVIGALCARVIVPVDFERRYSPEECRLMLAHERAHLARGDALVFAVAAAWSCLFWFNPLMFWALGRLRFDQDLACDAWVVSRPGFSRKAYADALLRAQMPIDSIWHQPVGCHWKSTHPLKERITMLKHSSPGRVRRASGVAIAVALAVSGICAVTWASAPAPAPAHELAAKLITVDAKDIETRDVLKMIADKGGQNILVSDAVRGKITVRLENIPWTKALSIVVQSQGLVTRQSGDITLIDVAR